MILDHLECLCTRWKRKRDLYVLLCFGLESSGVRLKEILNLSPSVPLPENARRGLCVGRMGGACSPVPRCQPDQQPGRLRIVAVNGTHRLPGDALAPLINVRSGAEGDKQTPNVTKCHAKKSGTESPTRAPTPTRSSTDACVPTPTRSCTDAYVRGRPRSS